MSRRPPRRSPLPKRRLRREGDGSLYDLDEHRRIEPAELADDVRAGRYFRVARASSGEDCTQEVLSQVILQAAPGSRTGGAGLGSMLTSMLGAIVNGAANSRIGDRDDRRRELPGGPGARMTRREPHEWWEGD
jgi:hypothetical protein